MNIKKDKKIKKYSKLIYIIVIIIMLLFIIFSILINSKKTSSQDEILFLKFLKIAQNQAENSLENKNNLQISNKNEEIVKYKFNITYKNLKLKNVNLADTIKQDTLTYEKIAPGVNGEFEIIIDSNKTMNYKINFNSLNEKPKNLQFTYEEGNIKANSLEELSNNLSGIILENTTKVIRINWSWDYENNQDGNIQDTKDAKNIANYNFNINVTGEEKV